MSAGRIRFLEPGAKGPKTPAFRLRLDDGGELVLTEGGPKKRARVGVYRPDELEAELAHLGPEADRIGAGELGEIAHREARRLHPFLRDQRALAGIGRAWSNEILNRAKLSPYALTTELSDEEVERLAGAVRELLAYGLEQRLAGAADKKVYRVHNRLGEPCPNCGTPIARVDFEEHTIFYCPAVPDRRAGAQGPAALAAAALGAVLRQTLLGARRKRDQEAFVARLELARRWHGRERGRAARRALALPRRGRPARAARESGESVEPRPSTSSVKLSCPPKRATARASCESARAVGSASTRTGAPRAGDRRPCPPPAGPRPRARARASRRSRGRARTCPTRSCATSRSWSTSSSIWAEAAPIIST